MWLRAVSAHGCSACLQVWSLHQSVLCCVMCVNIPSMQSHALHYTHLQFPKEIVFSLQRVLSHIWRQSERRSKCCEGIKSSRSNIVQIPDHFCVWKSYSHQTQLSLGSIQIGRNTILKKIKKKIKITEALRIQSLWTTC